MKLLVLSIILLIFSNQVIADHDKFKSGGNNQPSGGSNQPSGGNDKPGGNQPSGNNKPTKPYDRYKSRVCSRCKDSGSCYSKKCSWHDGHCSNTVDCTKYSGEDCLNHNGCVQKESQTNGRCIKRDYQCGSYGRDDCTQNANYCYWTSNYTCESVPGFVTNCAAKTIEECRTEQYCTYSYRCINNYYPSKSWKLCREDCLADQYSNWVVLHPAYCIDNVKLCSKYSLDECRNNTDHCSIERYYDEGDQQYNQCSYNNTITYKEKCVAIQYGCQDLTIEQCQQQQYCKVIDEIGQCYPKTLVNCETLSADDCATNSHCCLKQECSDNPQIVECPAKTPEDCQASEECRLIDNGSCSEVYFDCNLTYENCQSQNNYCQWISDTSYTCANKTVCRGLNYNDCKDYYDVCTWKEEYCKHKY